MFRRLSVFYVGHINLDYVGVNAPAADDRWHSAEALAGALTNATRLAELLETLPFSRLWLAEHHFGREGYDCIPNPLLLATWLCSHTSRLQVGSAFAVLPNWHPLRLAEDYAVADILSAGRVILGIGRGYQTREVETFGAPLIDRDANMALFLEQVRLLQRALRDDSFSFDGRFYNIPPNIPFRGRPLKTLTLVPRPLHRLTELWMPIGSGKTIEFMARHGISGMVTLNGSDVFARRARQYLQAAQAAGRRVILGEGLCLGIGFFISTSRDAAIAELRPYHDERYKWAAPLGYVRYHLDRPSFDHALPTLEDGVEAGAWLCGTSQELVESLVAIAIQYPGLEELMIHWPEGMPHDLFFSQLQRFAHGVIPELVKRGVLTLPADRRISDERNT